MTKKGKVGEIKPRFQLSMLRGEARKRFVKAILILLAAFLTFGGPTYLIYALNRWGVPHAFLILLGLASLLLGLGLFMQIGKEEKI